MYEKQGPMSNVQFGAYWEEESYGLLGASFKKDQYKGLALSAVAFTFGVNLSPEPLFVTHCNRHIDFLKVIHRF